MKIKDVNTKKIQELLDNTDDELYIVNISFEGSEPVLNLYKPYDDTELRKQKYNENIADLMSWIAELDKKFENG